MKILNTTVKKIAITDIKNLDPISVYLEDFNDGRGKLIITCWDKSWSYYWGGMGTRNLKEFILSADNHYLSRKLAPNIPSDINDEDNFVKDAKKQIIRQRREGLISKFAARELYDECETVMQWKGEEATAYEIMMFEIYGDEWWECLPKKTNPEYEYFSRILDTVKLALKENINENP
jgi:hypothetical protein